MIIVVIEDEDMLKSIEKRDKKLKRNLSVLDSGGETLHTFSDEGISPFLLATGRIEKHSERMEGSLRKVFI